MRLHHFIASLSIVAGCASPAPTAAPPVTPQEAPPSASAAPGAAQLKPAGEATIGDRTTCPTSGEEFTVTAASPKVEHEGKTYYFCCGGCDAKFSADPAKYLKKKPDA